MSLTIEQFRALLPSIALSLTAIVVMLLTAFMRRRDVTPAAAVIGLLVTFATLPIAGAVAPTQVTPLLRVDGAALFYLGLVLVSTLAVALLSAPYLEQRGEARGEFYTLLLISALGGAVLAASSNFATLFLGFELLSVSLFALLSYTREYRPGLEAGIKYLVLSGVSSGFLLLGIALIYYELGTLDFAALGPLIASRGRPDIYLAAGGALLVGGIAFKLSLAPFHLWTPDVYQGAPAPITAFLATVSKGAIFVVLLRYFTQSGAYGYAPLLTGLSILAAASMLIGNVLAVLQQNVKRILAYSSIAHLGYLLTAFIAGGAAAVEATGYYLAAYFASTVGAFGLIAVLSAGAADKEELQMLSDYRGLFWRRPWLASVFSLMLLSLAGIPFTVGFMGKFYIVAATVQGSLWALLAIVIIGSGIGLFYYLRVIVTMYLRPDETAAAPAEPPVSVAGHIVLASMVIAVVWLGVYPAPIIDLIRRTTTTLLAAG
jgi:NADH-quinone oxidoreductase subunit N